MVVNGPCVQSNLYWNSLDFVISEYLLDIHVHYRYFYNNRLAEKKAAIGYTYEDSTPVGEKKEEEESDEESDLDVETVDLGNLHVVDKDEERERERARAQWALGTEGRSVINIIFKKLI